MRCYLPLVALPLIVLVWSAQAEPLVDSKIKAEMDRVQLMQKELVRTGLWPFLDATKTEGWSVPWIHSDYWVGRLPEKQEERIKLEKANRAFGLSIAKALDAEALKIMEPADSTTREGQAQRLLDAADWLRKSRGYGNLLLVTRAENLAYVPIGYLVADLTFPTNETSTLMDRISTPEEDLDFRLAVLDEEAPAPMDIQRGGSVNEMNDRLDIAWAKRMNTVAAWCKTNGAYFPKASKHRAKMPPECAFFADDEVSTPPYTTVNRWNEKQHKIYCIYGGEKGIRQRVDTLYLFRSKVGSFATNPPAWFGPQEKIYTAIEAAFIQAWEPFEKNYGPIGQLAAWAYQSIRSNRLMDWETAQIVEALEKAKALSK